MQDAQEVYLVALLAPRCRVVEDFAKQSIQIAPVLRSATHVDEQTSSQEVQT